MQAFFILGGSLVSEGATLLVAVNSIKKGAKKNMMSFTEYGMSVSWLKGWDFGHFDKKLLFHFIVLILSTDYYL